MLDQIHGVVFKKNNPYRKEHVTSNSRLPQEQYMLINQLLMLLETGLMGASQYFPNTEFKVQDLGIDCVLGQNNIEGNKTETIH